MGSFDKPPDGEQILELTKFDLAEWLRGRRRFSTVRHPYPEDEFERKHLPKICASLGADLLFDRLQRRDSEDIPSLETACSFLASLSKNRNLEASVRIAKAWVAEKATSESWENLLEQAGAALEESTCKTGSPVTLITFVFKRKDDSGGNS